MSVREARQIELRQDDTPVKGGSLSHGCGGFSLTGPCAYWRCRVPFVSAPHTHPRRVMTGISRASTTPSSRQQQLSLPFRDRVLEMFSKREVKGKKRPHGAHHLIAGTTAGVMTTAALYPLDLVKTRYQVRRSRGARRLAHGLLGEAKLAV